MKLPGLGRLGGWTIALAFALAVGTLLVVILPQFSLVLVDQRLDLVVISAPMSTVGGTPELSPRYAMRQIARRWVAGEVAALRARGVEVVVVQPTPADIDVMSGNPMDPAKTPDVVEQVSATALAHVRDPRVAPRLGVLRRADT